MPTDDGHDGDKIYGFDGRTNAVVVPEGHADHRLREHFTISAWMKHTFPSSIESHHRNGNKEHIMCMSDGDGESETSKSTEKLLIFMAINFHGCLTTRYCLELHCPEPFVILI